MECLFYSYRGHTGTGQRQRQRLRQRLSLAEVKAGKVLRSSRDLVNYHTEDLAVCAMQMDYIMVDYISNVELDSSFEPTSPLNHHHY